MRITSNLCAAIFVIAGALLTISVNAAPYAAAVTNNAGTISFLLNEDADSVRILLNNGTQTNDLGALPKGPASFNLGAATNYQIVVAKATAPGFINSSGLLTNTTAVAGTGTKITNFLSYPLQVSSDANSLYNFYAPRGLAIDRNPNSPYFGRVYVGNSLAGTSTPDTAGTGGVARTVGDGIYAINPDGTDALGLGDTASTGGLNFGGGGTVGGTQDGNSPWRMTVGPDGTLYICDWSTNNGNLYYVNPTLQSGGFALQQLASGTFASTPVGTANTHGRISSVIVEGSRTAGNLKIYTIDSDLQQNKTTATLTQANSLWRYDVNGASFPFTTDASYMWSAAGGTNKEGLSTFTAQTLDLDKGTNGYYYINTYRSAGSECGVVVRNGNTTANATNTLFSSYYVSTNTPYKATGDILNGSYSMAVSPDLKYLASMNVSNFVWIVPMTNGIPDLSKRLILNAFPSTIQARSIRFDAADNLYVLSSGEQLLRVFSPGGYTIATTGNDSTGTNGTFNLQYLPSIYTQPVGMTTNAGGTITLTAVATGPDIKYQWQLNGVNIANATNSTYSVSNAQRTANEGYYKLVVTSGTNSVTSQTVLVDITDAVPIITLQPVANISTNAGTNVSFTVTAIGSPTLTYQWQFNGTNIANATATKLTLNNVQPANSGTYNVRVANYWGTTLSTDAALSVSDGLSITVPPVSKTVNAGSNVVFSVTTIGTDPRTYQWTFPDNSTPSWATNTSITITNAQAVDAGTYTITVSNPSSSSPQTASATLTVNDTPTVAVATNPKNTTAGAGDDVTFSMTAFGNGPLLYQWYMNSSPIQDATNSTYLRINVQTNDTGTNFYCSVQNSGSGPANSTTVFLTVTNKTPRIITQPTSLLVNAGDNATFAIVAQGQANLAYQWYYLGTNLIAGATASSLTINNVQLTNTGNYSVTITSGAGNTAGVSTVTSQAGVLSVTAASAPGDGIGLIGEYFSNLTSANAASGGTNSSVTLPPTFTRLDTNVDFSWSTGSPDPSITSDFFIARWYGQVQPLYSENYTFYTKTDDGVRLWVNDVLVIDKWVNQSGTEWPTTNIAVVAGQKYDVRMEYYENSSAAEAHLLWSSAHQLKQAIQTSQLYTNSGPFFVAHPTNGVATAGQSFTFNFQTRGNPQMTYTLLFNGSAVATGTDPSFTFVPQLSDAGNYAVVAANSFGTVTSAVAVLTVTTAVTPGTGTGLNGDYYSNQFQTYSNTPTLTRIDPVVDYNWGSGPSDPSVSAVNFTARWTGQIQPQFSDIYTFYTRSDDGLKLWVDGQLLVDKFVQGGTNVNNYTAVMAYPFVAGQKYDVRIDYEQGSAQSEVHFMWSSLHTPRQVVPQTQLYPQSAPYFVNFPTNTSTLVGSNVSFVASVGGTPNVGYQWQKNGSNLPGATTTILNLNNVQLADAGNYTLTATNSVGTRTNMTVLTVNAPPTIGTQPTNQTANVGDTVTFTMTAAGSAPLAYQWQKNGSAILNATTNSYSIVGVTTNDAGNYNVVVTNAFGSVTSATAVLTINSGSAPQPTLGSVIVSGSNLNFNFSTVTGHNYTIQFKSDLNDVSWTDVETFAGTGGTVNKSYAIGSGKGFYRIQVQ